MTIDSTRPHVGRIYDFVLGGHHNFEVDRQAVAEILKLVPYYPELARLNRWFLQLVAARWSAEGATNVLDLASGLPTQGHFNEYLPAARILFSDNDPLSVSYGQEILQGRPHQQYIQADLRQPEPLLAQARQFFPSPRKLCVGAIGIVYFLSDEVVRSLLTQLHELCAPGSTLALSFQAWPTNREPMSEAARQDSAQAAKLANIQHFLRQPPELAALVAPWRILEMRSLEDWLEMPGFVRNAAKVELDIEMFGLIATRD